MAYQFANSAAVPAPLAFSKQQLLEELSWFMPALTRSFVRLYGTNEGMGNSSAADLSLRALQDTPMWRSLSELYDYGVHGVLPTISALGDGSLLDVEMFLEGITGLSEYLREDDGGVPVLSKATISLARARLELDEADPAQEVTTETVARLARLPEDVVCNRLDTKPGTAISVRRAREVLVQLFGFAPTGCPVAPAFSFVPCIPMDLPIDVVRAISERAGLFGMAPFEVLRVAFAEEIRRDGYENASAALQSLSQTTAAVQFTEQSL